MKKLSLCLIGLSLLLPLLAQQGTVTMTFADCFTTYGEENLQVVFPYTYHGHEYTEPVSGETQTITNVRNCDSVVTLTLTEKPAPVGALNGNAVFSISATTKVYFSKGILQYQPSTNTYRFADTQCKSYSTTKPDYSTQEGWYEGFPYGSSGVYFKHSGASFIYAYPYNIKYNYEAPTQDIAGTDFDWGIYNDIHDGDKVAPKGTWRSITQKDFTYIMENRGTGKRGFINIGSMHGLVLLPDEWTWPVQIAETKRVMKLDDWKNVPTYTIEEWQYMENNGAVFFYSGTSSTACGEYRFGTYAGMSSSTAYAEGMSCGKDRNGWNVDYKNHDSYQTFPLHNGSPIRLISVKQ